MSLGEYFSFIAEIFSNLTPVKKLTAKYKIGVKIL